MSKRRITKQMIQTIALKRIQTLFTLAETQAKKGNINLANRYMVHARNLSMKNLTPIPAELKHQFCKHCYSFLHPGSTCRIRIHHGRIIKYCFQCKKIMRFPLK